MGRFPWVMRYASWLMMFVFGLGPLLWLSFRILTGEPTAGEAVVYFIIAGLGACVFIVSQITMATTEFGLTDERLVYKSGLISRNTNEIPLQSLENVNLHQSVFSRLFGYGRIEVNGSGGSAIVSHAVQDPVKLRASISEALIAMEHAAPPAARRSSINPEHNSHREG